jgi:hypothetical protein
MQSGPQKAVFADDTFKQYMRFDSGTGAGRYFVAGNA